MRRTITRIALAACALAAALAHDIQPAGAQSVVQIGWVLDQHGSTACYRQSNHVWCNSYPYGNPYIYARTVDDWLDLGCNPANVALYPGSNGGNPALLHYPIPCGSGPSGYVNSGVLCDADSCLGSFSRPGSASYGYVYTEKTGTGFCCSRTNSWIYGV